MNALVAYKKLQFWVIAQSKEDNVLNSLGYFMYN